MLSLILAVALSQAAQSTVALTINDQTIVVSVTTAERLLKSSFPRLRAAAVIALATVLCSENEARGLASTDRGRSCAAQRDAGLL